MHKFISIISIIFLSGCLPAPVDKRIDLFNQLQTQIEVGNIAWVEENAKDIFNIEQAITQINSDADIILIEGLKNMNYPKIEVHRKEISNEILFKKDLNIIAIVSDLLLDIKIPSFDLNDIPSIVDFIIQYKNSYGDDDPLDSSDPCKGYI